jgi:hypothetical protein
MLPPRDELANQSLEEIEIQIRCRYSDSEFWKMVWPVYDAKRRQAIRQQSFSYLVVPSVIFVVGIVYSVLAQSR